MAVERDAGAQERRARACEQVRVVIEQTFEGNVSRIGDRDVIDGPVIRGRDALVTHVAIREHETRFPIVGLYPSTPSSPMLRAPR